jgi:hypothetical protein
MGIIDSVDYKNNLGSASILQYLNLICYMYLLKFIQVAKNHFAFATALLWH